jgi:hypothetical protein
MSRYWSGEEEANLASLEQKHWIQRNLFLALTIIAVMTLFLVGLAFHELNVITPLDGFYMWLHSLMGKEPAMASSDNWHWGYVVAFPWWAKSRHWR